MKTNRCRKAEGGYALMMVLFFGGISLLALSGALQWCSSTARNTDRNNRMFAAVSAAEAATEKVLTSISDDYQKFGETIVYDNLGAYRDLHPRPQETAYWNGFGFSDAQGNANKTYVERILAWQYTPLHSQYEGLYGLASTYRIVSNAQMSDISPPIIGAVRQDIQVAAIPIFQFAIFYTMDLELHNGPAFTVTGRVHSNRDIYTNPLNRLTFLSHVTASGNIILGKSALDPVARTPNPSLVTFSAEHDAGVGSLNLPIGTNNTSEAVHAVLEIPPDSESTRSQMGLQRYYNKADVVIVVSNSTVVAKTGAWNRFGTEIPWSEISSFIDTNKSFFNKRELKWIKTTEIDVARLATWSGSSDVKRALGRDVNAIYVADMRSQTLSTESGVRIVNGAALPSKGLTVATPNPAYILGDFNAPVADRGTTNTLNTKPSSIVADAITILSSAWRDDHSTDRLSNRPAVNTTVNAAFLAGNVPSNGRAYSGGVENFPRFLEDWGNDTFTYNGSMVVMFASAIATAPWGGGDVYSAPRRNWAFDLNFMDATKLPPGTPQLLTTIRGEWAMIEPGTIQ